jgi:hypothetical protein
MRWHAICVLFYEPHARDHVLLPHDPFKALVAPRPIGWMSTRAADGRVNPAPSSFLQRDLRRASDGRPDDFPEIF